MALGSLVTVPTPVQVDTVRTTAEENINALLENFMGINDAELGETFFFFK